MKKIILIILLLLVSASLVGCVSHEDYKKWCIKYGVDRELKSKLTEATNVSDSTCLVYFVPFNAWISVNQFESLGKIPSSSSNNGFIPGFVVGSMLNK